MSTIYVNEPVTSGKVCLKTTVGDIDIELWCKECPLACKNFIQLCIEGYYNDCVFHRLVKDFIIQTGDPGGTGEGGESIYEDVFKSEFHQRLHFNRRGLVGMAGEKKDQNGSQFFFTFGNTPELNKKHTLFGKVANNTVFNLLHLNELEVDQNDRPKVIHKILDAVILLNPFEKEIKPRFNLREKKNILSEDKKNKKAIRLLAVSQNNKKLLSFGDELNEDEAENEIVKLKSKSAHDVLDDKHLSKEKAVHNDEIGKLTDDVIEEDGEEKSEGALDRIRERMQFAKRRKVVKFEENNEINLKNDDTDITNIIDEQKEAEKQEKLKQISDELYSLKKEYVKAVRGPKLAKNAEEEQTEAMKTYTKMKLKFKSGSKNILKSVNSKREIQTMSLLDRFKTKIDRASVGGILMDKKVDMSDQKTQEEIIAATVEEQGKIILDVEDLKSDEWLSHTLVAPEGIRKDARDANLKEKDKEWYPINDSRNVLRKEGKL